MTGTGFFLAFSNRDNIPVEFSSLLSLFLRSDRSGPTPQHTNANCCKSSPASTTTHHSTIHNHPHHDKGQYHPDTISIRGAHHSKHDNNKYTGPPPTSITGTRTASSPFFFLVTFDAASGIPQQQQKHHQSHHHCLFSCGSQPNGTAPPAGGQSHQT